MANPACERDCDETPLTRTKDVDLVIPKESAVARDDVVANAPPIERLTSSMMDA